MKRPLASFFAPVAIAFFLALPAFAANPTVAMKYPEYGNWVVQIYVTDAEGFPDTIERSVFSTEHQASEYIQSLHRSIGVLEKDATPSDDPMHELRPNEEEIWSATESWSLEWENKFADWTRENFDRKFFKRHKIETDCADAAVALRWIFSRAMHLPAGNRLDGTNALLTNRSVRSIWKNLPSAENWWEDRRFLRALDYVLVNTYTHSLHADAYPIRIDPEFLTEGAFHLELRTEDGHTRVFTDVSRGANAWPLEDMYSNVPRKVRNLVVEPFTVFVQPPMKFGGILRHRWTRLTESTAYLVPAGQMPGYSLEQYQPEFFRHGTLDFSAEVAARIQESVDPVEGLRSIFKNLNQAIDDRKTVVEEGYALCSTHDCSPGTQNYENWSTPSRDARLGQYFAQIENLFASLHGDNLARAKKLFAKERKKKLVKFDGKKRRYDEIAAIWQARTFSSDPRDPPAKRWGFVTP